MRESRLAPGTAMRLGAILAGVGTLAGCVSAADTAATRTDTVVVASTSAPASLDFTTTSGAAIPQALMGNVYETLVHIDDSGVPQPLLAESWDVSADGTRYLFHLRQGVTFSDGSAFNAETAKFSIDRVATEWTNGWKRQMSPVTETRVLDASTLEVTLSGRSSSWLWSMGTLTGAMMSPTGVDHLATAPVGTGPYQVAEWNVGQELRLSARPDYWGAQPGLATAILRYFPDSVSSVNALETGDVDVLWGLSSPELLDSLEADGRWRVDVGSTNGEFLLSMNNRREPFTNPAVRQAVMYAVDRQAVIDTVWDGYGIDTGGVPVAPSDPWYQPSSHYPFDPDRARSLLESAGYATDGTDDRLSITLTAPSLPYAQATSELIYAQLREVGFQMTIASAEFPAVWLAQVLNGHDYDMSLISHVEARDFATIFANPDYYVGFDSPRVRQLVAQADAAEDPVPLLREAVDEVMAQAASDTLMNVPSIVISHPSITGVQPTQVTDALPLAELGRQS